MPQGPTFWFDTRIYLGVAAALLFVISLYNHYVAALGAILLYALYRFGRDRFLDRQKALNEYLETMDRQIDAAAVCALQHLPVGIALVDREGRFHWRNALMLEWFGEAAQIGQSLMKIFPSLLFDKVWGEDGHAVVEQDEKYYHLLHRCPETFNNDAEQGDLQALYIFDVTEKETIRQQCFYSQPVLAYIQIDNYDEVLKGLNESRRTEIIAEVNQHLNEWVARRDGYLKKVADDLFFAILSRQALEQITTGDRFDILDEVRSISGNNNLPVTLSLGVAAEEPSIAALGQRAQAGLDLALGRGGDQATVHIAGRVQFFGGKTKAVEKNTRVKARIVAQALREIIDNSANVLIMGHGGEDFDSLGAALGVAKMVRHQEIPVNIVVSQPGQSLEKLMELLPDYEEYQGLFIRPAQAMELQGLETVVVVVDTHRPALTAAPELIAHSERTVVIDHHRRGEDFVANPLLVYLEPSASSTSELVTELLMYFDESLDLNRMEASALYAGLVVDTKNFAVQTGVRTFDAAAYLRRAGADPSLVRHLFRVDFETIRIRSAIISDAELPLPGVAVSVCPADVKNAQVISAQTADMLLNVEGIQVSFILFSMEDGTGVSARSQGDINVQLIMEALGGGGHQAVAGAQVKGATVSEVKLRIIALMSDYMKESE
ncbi:MAG TPA: DHH family phosphoesterase [Patescibacteria group bacterium]|nr:DHH family phosphoesterase [Patescibacteria group bacterium]